MIKINLIPNEIKVQEKKRQMTVLAVTGAGLLVFMFVGLWAGKFYTAHKLKKELEATEKELTKYKKIVDQVEMLELTKNQLKNRRDIINQLLSDRLLYPVFFQELLQILPSEVWLVNMKTSSPPGASSLQITITANSNSNFAIADFITNLEQSKFFSDVKLSKISLAGKQGEATLNFNLTFSYKRNLQAL